MEAEDITEVSENLDYLCMSEMVITIIDTTKTKDLLEHILNSAIELDVNEADAWEYESEDWKMVDTILRILVITIPFIILGLTCYQTIKLYKEDMEFEQCLLTQRQIEEENNTWEELQLDTPNNTYECVMEIIDDATCNGFEFKVDNGKIYFREVE